MRNRAECVAEGREFLDELIAHDMSVGEPKKLGIRASEQARNWCKAHGYAKHVYAHGQRRRTGWIITADGRRRIAEGLPL